MKKKNYVIPTIDVVVLQQQCPILAGSAIVEDYVDGGYSFSETPSPVGDFFDNEDLFK